MNLKFFIFVSVVSFGQLQGMKHHFALEIYAKRKINNNIEQDKTTHTIKINNKKKVASISYSITPNGTSWIHTLWVHPDHRKKGIATELLYKACSHMKHEKSLYVAGLPCAFENNNLFSLHTPPETLKLRKYYKSFGAKELSHTDGTFFLDLQQNLEKLVPPTKKISKL